jgi:hypothetical protein
MESRRQPADSETPGKPVVSWLWRQYANYFRPAVDKRVPPSNVLSPHLLGECRNALTVAVLTTKRLGARFAIGFYIHRIRHI